MENKVPNASMSVMMFILTLRIGGGLMGFQLLPVEDGDEFKHDVFTITSPKRWNPHKFANEITNDSHFYDPSDMSNDSLDYPAMINHTMKEAKSSETTEISSLKSSSNSILDSQVLATTTWHRVLHHDIDPEKLRPYLGHRP